MCALLSAQTLVSSECTGSTSRTHLEVLCSYGTISGCPTQCSRRETPSSSQALKAIVMGLQGLDWYTKGLKEDRDGDVATEFLEEASTPCSVQKQSTVEDAQAALQVGNILSCRAHVFALN